VFVALNRDELLVRARSGGELAERVRRAEDYAGLGARWWSCTAKATPPTLVPARGRSPAAPTAATGWPGSAPAAPSAATPTALVGPIAPADLTNPRSTGWLRILDDPIHPDQPTRPSPTSSKDLHVGHDSPAARDRQHPNPGRLQDADM
jgi:hypothetical protein